MVSPCSAAVCVFFRRPLVVCGRGFACFCCAAGFLILSFGTHSTLRAVFRVLRVLGFGPASASVSGTVFSSGVAALFWYSVGLALRVIVGYFYRCRSLCRWVSFFLSVFCLGCAFSCRVSAVGGCFLLFAGFGRVSGVCVIGCPSLCPAVLFLSLIAPSSNSVLLLCFFLVLAGLSFGGVWFFGGVVFGYVVCAFCFFIRALFGGLMAFVSCSGSLLSFWLWSV